MLFSLSGCGNNLQTKDSNKEQVESVADSSSEETNTDEINTDNEVVNDVTLDYTVEAIPLENLTAKEYAFYTVVNIYAEQFEKDYALVGHAIDNYNINDYNYYLNRLQFDIDSLNSLDAPESMEVAKEQLVKSFVKFRESVVYLQDAYQKVDYGKFEGFLSAASIANAGMTDFLEISNNMTDFVEYYSALKETAYYGTNFNLYVRNDKFSAEENIALFTIDRTMNQFSATVDDAIISHYNKTGVSNDLVVLEDEITTLKKLDIENENLNTYRNEVVECLTSFYTYLNEFFTGLETDSVEELYSKTSEIRKNARRLYDSMTYMKAFYEEKGLTLEYESSQIYQDFETNYEYEVEDDGSISPVETESDTEEESSEEVEIIG